MARGVSAGANVIDAASALDDFATTAAAHRRDADAVAAARRRLARVVGDDGVVVAAGVHAFFMAITRVVDASGHRNYLVTAIVQPLVLAVVANLRTITMAAVVVAVLGVVAASVTMFRASS